MIYTCTLNPAVDYKFNLENINIGKLNRVENANFFAGGKGINVSIVLKNLGTDSIATGFLGGFTGDFIKNTLKSKHIKYEFIDIELPSRFNVKIKHPHMETEINADGPHISNSKMSELLIFIQEMKKDDLLITGGSTCKGQPEAHGVIAQICHEQGIPFVMDTPGKYYSQFLKYKPFLVKPNLQELGDYYGTKIMKVEQAIFYGKKLLEEGAERVIISMGGNGSIYLDKYYIYRSNLIHNKVTSSVGSGDSMVAGFIASYLSDKDTQKAYQFAVAVAQATTFHEGLATYETTMKYYYDVNVKEISK
jgi:1-phosphofructokinase